MPKLEFGLHTALPPNCPFGWGARAIYSSSNLAKGKFDIPYDRKDSFGELGPRTAMLKILIEDKALDISARWLYDHNIGNNDDATYTLYDQSDYVIKGRSYGGYIYLVAYPHPDFLAHRPLYEKGSE